MHNKYNCNIKSNFEEILLKYIINIKENINISLKSFILRIRILLRMREKKKKEYQIRNRWTLEMGIFLNKTLEIEIANIY